MSDKKEKSQYEAGLDFVVSWITQAVSIALLLLIACAVAAKYGLRLPMVPTIDGTALAYLCGAWWLWRGRA